MYDDKVVKTWTKNLLLNVSELYKSKKEFLTEQKIFLDCFCLNFLEKKLSEFEKQKIISDQESKEIFFNLNEIIMFHDKRVFLEFLPDTTIYYAYFCN